MENNWLFIHGGWGGSWQWSPIIKEFNRIQVQSIAPDMPGMGGTCGKNISLVDFVNHCSEIIFMHKNPINIAAFSFGGLTATAIAGKYPERINKLFFIDAFVPDPGQTFTDMVGEKVTRQIISYTDVMGENQMIPPFLEIDERYCSHPLNTLFSKVDYEHQFLEKLQPIYIECSRKDPQWAFTPLLKETAKRINSKGWPVHTIESDHMPMYSHTKELVEILKNG